MKSFSRGWIFINVVLSIVWVCGDRDWRPDNTLSQTAILQCSSMLVKSFFPCWKFSECVIIETEGQRIRFPRFQFFDAFRCDGGQKLFPQLEVSSIWCPSIVRVCGDRDRDGQTISLPYCKSSMVNGDHWCLTMAPPSKSRHWFGQQWKCFWDKRTSDQKALLAGDKIKTSTKKESF